MKNRWIWLFIIVDAIVVGALIYWAIRGTSSPPGKEEEPTAIFLEDLAPGASTTVEVNESASSIEFLKVRVIRSERFM